MQYSFLECPKPRQKCRRPQDGSALILQNGRLATHALSEACRAFGPRCQVLLREGAAVIDVDTDSGETRASSVTTASGRRCAPNGMAWALASAIDQ